MSALPVAQVLVELGREAERASYGAAGGLLAPPNQQQHQRRNDTEERIKQVREEGFAAGQAAERADCETKLARLSAAFETRLAEERQKWVREQGDLLAERIAAAVQEVETRLADTLARTLKPVLSSEARRRAIADLIGLVDGLISKGEVTTLAVSGPQDLVQTLQSHLDGKLSHATFAVSEGCDLKITSDETTFETRIADWARAIEGTGP